MLGSHNSLTYLPCRKWWMYLINWAAKCQSKTLNTQFHDGAKYFDFRVRFKDGKPVIAHGLIEYKGNIDYMVANLNYFAEYFKETIYLRFVLEYNKIPEDFASQIASLVDLVRYYRGKYPNITYTYIMSKWNEQKVATYYSKDTDTPTLIHKYSSVLKEKRFLWIPYWYAKLHNKTFLHKYTKEVSSDSDVLMLDFV
mgnify:CR=1 FL=1